MLKADIIEYYGTGTAAAKALGRKHRSCVSNWPDLVPESVAREFAAITRGKLKYKPAMYRETPTGEQSAKPVKKNANSVKSDGKAA